MEPAMHRSTPKGRSSGSERANRWRLGAAAIAVLAAGCAGPLQQGGLDRVGHVIVIYAENRSFDNLYGLFPGANGISNATPEQYTQVDRDGKPLAELPPAWKGKEVDQAFPWKMPNKPFRLDAPPLNLPLTKQVRSPIHEFYRNQEQIDGGRNDRFAAVSDAGGYTMGYYDGSPMAMWKWAQEYTLADNFFMGAFGGSYLNHQYLICACIPVYPEVDNSPAKNSISEIETDAQGRFVRLVPGPEMPKSVLSGPPRYKHDATLTRGADGVAYTINTMQPAYQPSSNAPTPADDPRYSDKTKPTTLPPQTLATIGDRLDAKGVSWAWYAGAWSTVNAGTAEARKNIYSSGARFQAHHQPFNYYATFDPKTRAAYRDEHLRDFDSRFFADAAAGRLPSVTFYKPQGTLNQHPGYANLSDGDAHIAEVIAKLQQSPQWPHMLIVVTYDENGGFWDHARVPKGDRWGPGTRIPAIIVSPLAKKGVVDKTQYDTASILRFITRRWALEPLPGVVLRDEALKANGLPPMGDLSAALVAR